MKTSDPLTFQDVNALRDKARTKVIVSKVIDFGIQPGLNIILDVGTGLTLVEGVSVPLAIGIQGTKKLLNYQLDFVEEQLEKDSSNIEKQAESLEIQHLMEVIISPQTSSEVRQRASERWFEMERPHLERQLRERPVYDFVPTMEERSMRAGLC